MTASWKPTGATPWVGIVMRFVFANLAEPGGGGLTVKLKLFVVLLTPSLAMTVMVEVPVWPKTGVTEIYLWIPGSP